jgi:hypothetical protein
MWKCERCGEEIEDQFKSCWKCADQEADLESKAQRAALQCLRCQTGMEYQGRKHLHEGDWIESTHHLPVDAYVCPRCGHLELYAGNVGEEFATRVAGGVETQILFVALVGVPCN